MAVIGRRSKGATMPPARASKPSPMEMS